MNVVFHMDVVFQYVVTPLTAITKIKVEHECCVQVCYYPSYSYYYECYCYNALHCYNALQLLTRTIHKWHSLKRSMCR